MAWNTTEHPSGHRQPQRIEDWRRLAGDPASAVAGAVVKMVRTTFTAELPGVTGAEGANEHEESLGRLAQKCVTAALNDDPTP